MARDRQRSKARQRARAAGQKPGGKPARSRARDIGLDDPKVEEAGLTDAAPAPDPLKNASADVDQARAAEAGADRGPPGDEVELQPDADDREPLPEDTYPPPEEMDLAPDEVEVPADLVPARRTRRGAEPDSEFEVEPAEHKDRGKVIAFLGACVDELRRVQWPDRKHVFQATAVVLGFVVIAGAWLGLMDAVWQPLINAIL